MPSRTVSRASLGRALVATAPVHERGVSTPTSACSIVASTSTDHPTSRRLPGSRRTPIQVVAWRGRGPHAVCSHSMSRKAPPGAGMTPAKTSARRSSRAPRSVTTAVPVSSRASSTSESGWEEPDDPARGHRWRRGRTRPSGRPARCLRLPSRATPCHRCAPAGAGPGRGPRQECRKWGAPCGSSCRVPPGAAPGRSTGPVLTRPRDEQLVSLRPSPGSTTRA